MSTTGKSSVVKCLEEKYGYKAFYENDEFHLLRDYYNLFKKYKDQKDKEEWVLSKVVEGWNKLFDMLRFEQEVAFDGYFLHEFERSIWINGYSGERIQKYIYEVDGLLREHNCFLVFLYKRELDNSVYSTFRYRKADWKEYKLYQVSEIGKTFGERIEYEVDSKKMILACQNKMLDIYDELSMKKIKIDSDENNWDDICWKIKGEG